MFSYCSPAARRHLEANGIDVLTGLNGTVDLLRKLREEGAGTGPIAIFLYNRAVKLFLLLAIIAYFGWAYVVILTVLAVLASVGVGWLMSVLFCDKRC